LEIHERYIGVIMEIRKVQMTGGASFVITLPKDWAVSAHIKKNDPLGLAVQPDGTLLVTKDLTEVPVQRIKTIDISSIKDATYLFRLLIGTYIAGFTTIELRSASRFPPFVAVIVRDFTQMTIGPEVVEETDNRVVLKDLLNPLEMPFDNTIRRMFVIAKNMYIDAITVLETSNEVLADEVIARDNDVDRLQWLVARQTNMILKNVNLSRKMGLSPADVLHTFLVSRIIERIGDHAVRIVENSKKIFGHDLDRESIETIRRANKLAMEIFDRSIVSFFARDMLASNENIEALPALDELCEKINAFSMDHETILAISLHYIAESIRRAGEYAGDISENVINFLVEEEIRTRQAPVNQRK
jgi:phosphate uptake regulator